MRARSRVAEKVARSRRIAAADSGRISRSGSVALAMKPSKALGTVGATDDGDGTRSDRCLYAIAIGVSPVNGSVSVSSSKPTMPSEYRSERGSAGSPRICSGARYCTVPVTAPARVFFASANARASPRSVTFTTPSVVIRMFSGFRSRWTMPRVCAWSSAASVWSSTAAAWAGARAPRAFRISRTERPCTYSITM